VATPVIPDERERIIAAIGTGKSCKQRARARAISEHHEQAGS
jgi:hypothetical protein